MLIKILDDFSYQTFPITDDMIDVTEEQLKVIGKTLKFDKDNNCIVGYEKPVKTEEEIYQEKLSKYPTLVEEYVRERYSLSAEIAIIRQKDEKIAEFVEYYNYAEDCKIRAKETLGLEVDYVQQSIQLAASDDD